MIESREFPNIMNRVNSLEPIINQYAIEDVAMASFCISVYVCNRSVIESILALNCAVANHRTSENKKIKNYKDFTKFFEEIENIMQPDEFTDYIEEDFGEVSIEVFGKKYPVIIGTGHNMVFACLQFLPYLAKQIHKENELKEVIEYYSAIITFLKDDNLSDGTHEIRFVLPPERLFNRVRLLFSEESIMNRLESISKIVDSEMIEKKHIIINNGKYLPLANTSLLLDLYDLWYKSLDTEARTGFINHALTGITLSLSKLEGENDITFLCPAARTENINNGLQLERYPFVMLSKKGVILPINSGEYKPNEIEELYDSIITTNREKDIFFAELVSRTNSNQYRGITIKKDTPIKFLVIDSWANPEEDYINMGRNNEKFKKCNALDVVYYLYFMHDADEFYDYLNYKNEENSSIIIGFGGDSSKFLMWQKAGHMLEKGAVQYGVIDIGYNGENEYVIDYYRKKLKCFPIGRNDYILDNPFSWDIKEIENGFYQLVLKEHHGYGGLYTQFSNGCYFFFSQNVKYFNGIKDFSNYKDVISLMEDIFKRMLNILRETIEKSEEIRDSSIQVMMMPIEYAKKVGMKMVSQENERNYVYSDSYKSNDKIIIRYVLNINNVFNAISEAEDKSVEIDLFLDTIAPLKEHFPILYNDIISITEPVRREEKEVSVSLIKIDYKWNCNEEKRYIVKDDSYHRVRKHIAKVCLEAGIIPGVYFGQDATLVIRRIQQRLIADFEKEVSKYNSLKFYESVLGVYASLVHEIMILRKRYEGISEINTDVKNVVLQEIINQREETKHNARVSLYLIETILFISKNGKEVLTTEKIQDLFAYANWLVVLSEDSDKCFFTEKEVKIEVTSEYLIEVDTNTGLRTELADGAARRQYDDPGFIKRDYDEDLKQFEIVKDNFQKDTNIKYDDFIVFLSYLESGGAIGKELSYRNNVLCFWKEDIINDFCGMEKMSILEAKKIMNFITIKTDELKTKNGKSDYYLPIGEKEKRNNRYEVKPIYENEDMLIYAPSVINSLKLYWLYSMYEFCIPFEIGLSETKKALDEWKRIYEKRIVYDLEEEFKNKGFVTRHNFDLKKINKKKYPDYLGDYDVFAVQTETKEIWMIECKVLEKVETFYEMFRQQNRFFNEDKYDEKFQRRIDFMQENYMDVMIDLNLPNEKYTIKPFMCVNKVFISRYKEVKFPIKSYKEMVELINKIPIQ